MSHARLPGTVGGSLFAHVGRQHNLANLPSTDILAHAPQNAACHTMCYPWKSDATPTDATVIADVPVPLPMGVAAAAASDVRTTLGLGFKGVEHAFMQRGSVFEYCADAHGIRHTPIPFAPVALGGGSARIMLKALGFAQLVHATVEGALKATSTVQQFFESLLILIPFVMDDAASNRLCFDYLVDYYEQYNIDNEYKVAIMLVFVKCVAHQINLASLLGLSNVGGDTPAECREFTKRFIGQSKVLGHSAYVSRVWTGGLKGFASMKFMTFQDARVAGVPIATASEQQMKIALVSYLLKWVTNRAELSQDMADAVGTVVGYLPATLWHWVTNTIPVHIIDDGCSVSYEQFVVALTLILHRVTKVFSQGRWTTGSPAFAQTALWLIFYRFSAVGMANGFDREKVMKAARDWAKKMNLDDGDAFQYEATTRLGRAFLFHGDDRDACYSCIKACFVNAPAQRALFFVFAADSGRHPDLVDHASRYGLGENLDGVCGGCVDDARDVRERDPPAVAMARQTVAKDILREGAQMSDLISADF